MSIKRPIGRNNLDKALHRLFKDDVDYFARLTKARTRDRSTTDMFL